MNWSFVRNEMRLATIINFPLQFAFNQIQPPLIIDIN